MPSNSQNEPRTRGPVDWETARDRYRNHEWRARIFFDLIRADLASFPEPPTLLDIGCGRGFDGEKALSVELARTAQRMIGIEPDPAIELSPVFTDVYRCRFEDASIAPESVHLAWSVMVLEHLEFPERFWHKLHQSLRPGGVFWGITVDARHWFAAASRTMERFRLKDLYLNAIRGTRGLDRYHNYPAFYRSNTPQQLARLTRAFSACEVVNFNSADQVGFYLPRALRWAGRVVDRTNLVLGGVGSLLAVRVVR